jgi:iron complex outermembrane receptor protein
MKRVGAAVSLCILLCGSALGHAGPADSASAPLGQAIPSQPLAQALDRWARVSGLQVIYGTQMTDGKMSPGAPGGVAAREALEDLLRGSGLTANWVNGRTVTLTNAGPTGDRAGDKAATPAETAKEGKSDSSRDFRVARVDQASSGAEVTAGPASEALEEIVVTAQRRAESLDRTPISVSAYSQQTMDAMHIQSIADLATVVPGLVVTTVGGNTASQSDIAIRGVFSGGNAPTTEIYIDETPIAIRRMDAAGYSGSPQPDIFDLERVEVLRGPQGTLFGAGAMGGAIRYITPQPNLTESSGYAKAEVGLTDHGAPSYAVGVAYGAALVPNSVGFRVSGWFHSDGGFVDEQNPFTGALTAKNANSSASYVLRPAFTVVPLGGLTITPAAYLEHQHSNASDQYWTSDVPNPEAEKHSSGMGLGPTALVDDLKVFSLAARYDAASVSVQSDTSYLNRRFHDFDDWTGVIPYFLGSPAPLLYALPNYSPYDQNISSTRAWQQEFRVSSRGDQRVTWVAGAYYRRAVTELSQLITDADPASEVLYGVPAVDAFGGVPQYSYNGQQLSAYSDFYTTDDQRALFGEATVSLTTHLKANIGVRIEHSEVRDQKQTLAGPFAGVALSHTTAPDEIDKSVTPRFGLTYQITDAAMAYATAGKGYRSGGSNSGSVIDNPLCAQSARDLGFTSVPATYRSDSLWSYEVGAKVAALDRRLDVQASAYYIDWSKVQTRIYLASCGNYVYENIGKQVSQGFDLQVAAVPLHGLKLSASVGYTNAYYPDTTRGAPVDGVAPIIRAAGEKVAYVLPWTAAAHAEYTHGMERLWDRAQGYVRLDYRWLDRLPQVAPVDASYVPQAGPYPSQAYGVLNVRVGVVHEGLDLSVFVNNATRADPRLDASYFGTYSATAIRPLTAGITGLYRF